MSNLSHRQKHTGLLPPNEPLSLQKTSIIYVVRNLEQFPPDVLALLPTRTKREIYQLLPPADILQLDQTSAVNGIDMDKEMWKPVYDHCESSQLFKYSRMPALNEASRGSFTWKERFVACVLYLLLHMQPFNIRTGRGYICRDVPGLIVQSTSPHRNANERADLKHNYMVFLQLLFCSGQSQYQESDLISGFPLKVFGKPLCLSRYSHYICIAIQVPEWIHFLLNKCRLQPPRSFTINDADFLGNDVDLVCKNQSVFKYLFQQVVHLKLSLHCPSNEVGIISHQQNILEMLTFSCQKLESIELTTTAIGRFGTHTPITHNYHPRHSMDRHVFNGVLNKLFHHSSSVPSSPFNTLRHVCIIGDGNSYIDPSTTWSLLFLLQTPLLETLFIKKVCIGEGNKIVYTSTTPLSPLCTSITFDHITNLSFTFFHWLLGMFLSSPSNNPQTLTLSNCHSDINYSATSDLNTLSMPLMSPSSGHNSNKTLHIKWHMNTHPLLLKAVNSLPLLLLERLELEYLTDSWTEDIKLNNFLAVIMGKSVSSIKHFTYHIAVFYQLEDSLEQKIVDEIDSIFSSLHLISKTAVVTLKITLMIQEVKEAVLQCLYSSWKLNSGGLKVDKLCLHIFVSSSSEEYEIRSSISANEGINDLAKTVEICFESCEPG